MRRLALFALIAACAPKTAPRWAEALVVVDTDLPAPAIASDVRIDFFREDGSWFESRDLPAPDAASWPLSFSVFAHEEAKETRLLLRIRVYPAGRDRDYRAALPQLDRGHGIETPATEPLPRLTVDRLVLLRLTPGAIGRATIVLRGACAGTVAQLAGAPDRDPVFAQARTCIEREGILEPVQETPLEVSTDRPTTTAIGSFGASAPCVDSGSPDVACVPSAAFVFGGPRLGNVNVTSTMPDRIVRVSRFWIDRQEVSVKRYRAALADGLARPSPAELRVIHAQKNADACTFDDQSGTNDDAPLNCIFWDAARAFCRFRGGDLPTEAQWELAATAGRAYKSRHPWGDADPKCDGAVYGRAFPDLPGDLTISNECLAGGTPGPVPERSDVDRSALGIFALAGSMSEWARDTGVDFGNDCWTSAPSLDPSCAITGDTRHAVRGGSWLAPASQLDDIVRDIRTSNEQENAHIGLRCVYPSMPVSWK